MEIQEFQKKLAELSQSASENGKILKGDQIRSFFEGMDLNREQLLQIFRYFKSQGIHIEGISFSDEQESQPVETEEEKARKAAEAKELEKEDQRRADRIQGNQCLTAEDKEYLKRYKESLKKPEDATEHLEQFLPLAADLAAEMFRDGMNLADLIQEANVALLNIFAGDMEGVTDSDIRERLRKGVKEAANQQDEQKFEDDCLVAKVQNLDNVMKDLTDGDEGEPKFSVEELAIMLDMDIDEMKDIIRLTGCMKPMGTVFSGTLEPENTVPIGYILI